MELAVGESTVWPQMVVFTGRGVTGVDAAAEAEFSEFMDGRWLQLLRLGYVLTGDRGLAEDLAQTALARACASWPQIRRAGDPDAYVWRVMVNANHSRFRKRRVAEQLTRCRARAAPGGGGRRQR